MNQESFSRSRLADSLISLPRYTKRTILVIFDLLLVSFALWLSFTLRLATPYFTQDVGLLLLLAFGPFLMVYCFYYFGLYKIITRFSGTDSTIKIYMSVAITIPLWTLCLYLSGYNNAFVPRSVIIMFGLFSAVFMWASRQILSLILKDDKPFTKKIINKERIPVLIYGAGQSAVQLFQSLVNSSKYDPRVFIDDDHSMLNQVIHGRKVYSPDRLDEVIQANDIREVFITKPKFSRKRRAELLKQLSKNAVSVKILPAIEDITSGRITVSDLRNVGLVDLLSRDPVPPKPELLAQDIKDKAVMVTGAGGSIGSEISRQILSQNPKLLLLFDISELALYNIELELSERLEQENLERRDQQKPELDIQIIPVLGSILDDQLVRRTISAYDIETIYHAAAYKHVPLVEINPVQGLRNNAIGTFQVALAAKDMSVKRFILISTDKAVRPTNIMGASKRLAELGLQALDADDSGDTIFTMVRFGNVLGSSGSVIERFRRQVNDGGPITVTHPEIIRYFMLIPEAAQLVIQAGSMSKGGDVFVLDMGEPVKILDLAKSMIHLSGLEILDEDHPDGDIEIKITGLRKGEKLYEELLIGENTTPTSHAFIQKNKEPFLSLEQFNTSYKRLIKALDNEDLVEIEQLLLEIVEGYQPDNRYPAKSKPGLTKNKNNEQRKQRLAS